MERCRIVCIVCPVVPGMNGEIQLRSTNARTHASVGVGGGGLMPVRGSCSPCGHAIGPAAAPPQLRMARRPMAVATIEQFSVLVWCDTVLVQAVRCASLQKRGGGNVRAFSPSCDTWWMVGADGGDKHTWTDHGWGELAGGLERFIQVDWGLGCCSLSGACQALWYQ